MEKDAAGYPSLPLHYGLMNPGISRYLASRLPYLTSSSEGAGKQQCFPATRLLTGRRGDAGLRRACGPHAGVARDDAGSGQKQP